jgi:hypothetical protein
MTQNIETSNNVQPGRTLSWYEVWIQAFTQPSVATYQALVQDPQASPKRAYIWIGLSVLAGAFITSVGTWLWTGAVLGLERTREADMLCGPLIAVVMTVLFIAMVAGGANLIARLFGGEGTYSALVYAFAAYTAPLSLISGVLGAIPSIGAFLALLLGCYALVLSVIAVKAVYKFEWWKAIVTLVLALPGIVVIVAFVVIMVLVFLGPLIQAMFELFMKGLQ